MDKIELANNLSESLEKAIRFYGKLYKGNWRERLLRLARNPIKVFIRKYDVLFPGHRLYFLVKTKTFFGYPIHIHSYEQDLWLGGFLNSVPEICLTKFIIKQLQPGDMFFDIGSHHGFYTLLAHKILAGKGQVHAFEPTPKHFRILKKNADLPGICLNECAVSNESGKLNFFQSRRSISTINKDFFKNVAVLNEEKFKMITVPAITLDDYCDSKKICPTLIKIDVEGSEFNVLMGAVTTLKKCKPIIAMEIWGKGYDNTNHLKAVDFLAELGYRPYQITINGDLTIYSGKLGDIGENVVFKAF